MKKNKRNLKKSKWEILIWIGCILYYALTFVFDKFTIDFTNAHIIHYIFIKIFVLIIIGFIGHFLVTALNNKEYQKYLKYFLIYFIPLFIILILIWPGNWYGGDVHGFLSYVKVVSFGTYLHYLTSVFYSIGASLFPTVSGPIILQILLMSCVVSYIVKNSFDYFKNSKLCYLLYVPFFLPVVIFYTMYVNRPVTYGMLYLLLITIWLFDYLNKKELTLKKLLFLSLLIAIVGNWRSEAIYLIIAAPILVFVSYRLKLNIKNISKICGFILVFFITVMFPQKYLTRNQDFLAKSSRNLPTYVNPLSVMLTRDLHGKNLEKNLEKIDKVLVIDSLKNYPNPNEVICFYMKDSCLRPNYTEKEFKDFQKAYISLISENPRYFLSARYHTFMSASRIGNDYFTAYDNNKWLNDYFTFKRILPESVRNITLTVVEGRTSGSNLVNVLYRFTMNLFIPIIGLGVMLLVSFIRRNWQLFLVSGMMLGHVAILVLTVPASYFMYYYNVYLIGMFLICFYGIMLLIKHKKEKNN